jgi:hypothetical protein
MSALQLVFAVAAGMFALPLLLVALLCAAAGDSTMFPEFSRVEQRKREAAFFAQFGLPPSGRLEHQPDAPNIGASRTSRLFRGVAS